MQYERYSASISCHVTLKGAIQYTEQGVPYTDKDGEEKFNDHVTALVDLLACFSPSQFDVLRCNPAMPRPPGVSLIYRKQMFACMLGY